MGQKPRAVKISIQVAAGPDSAPQGQGLIIFFMWICIHHSYMHLTLIGHGHMLIIYNYNTDAIGKSYRHETTL